MRAPDPAFSDSRLAVLYDVLDPDRSDLDVYAAIVDEVSASTVIDIGCGTGSLAVLLAAHGKAVVALDPADASLDVARAKPLADRVVWIAGDATALWAHELSVDLVVMTGNAAQVFVADEDWYATLAAAHDALRPGGWLVFETRRPEAEDWERWDMPATAVRLADGTSVVLSRTVTDVALPLVTFEASTRVAGHLISSLSTLRFRGRSEVEGDLQTHGFEVVEVRDAPDRPGKEYVFLARRNDR